MLDWTIFWLAIAVIFVWISAVEVYKWFSKPKKPQLTETQTERFKMWLDKIDTTRDQWRTGGPKNPEYTTHDWCPRCGDHEFRECKNLETGEDFKKCERCGHYYGRLPKRPEITRPLKVVGEPRPTGMVPELAMPYNGPSPEEVSKVLSQSEKDMSSIYQIPLHMLSPELAMAYNTEGKTTNLIANIYRVPLELLIPERRDSKSWPVDKNIVKPVLNGNFREDPNLPK